MLNRETFGSGPNLTLIHGWGADNGVWRDWAQACLSEHFTCHLIELPGFGHSPIVDAETSEAVRRLWREALIEALPEGETALLGWSLGGLLAQDIALHAPERITHLIGLATSPRFVQAESWEHGVPPRLIADFLEVLVLDVALLLKRFWMLQWQGSPRARRLMKQFVAEMKGRSLPSLTGLRQGLALLRTLDFRAQLSRITQPTLWLLGEKDPLIPVGWVRQLADLQPHAQVVVIPDAAHLPFRSHPRYVATTILKLFSFDRL